MEDALVENNRESPLMLDQPMHCMQGITLRHARFGMQALISSSVIVFCMFEISCGEKSPVYYSLLSGVVGFWLPAPTVAHTHD